jgi:hypothetical protein
MPLWTTIIIKWGDKEKIDEERRKEKNILVIT